MRPIGVGSLVYRALLLVSTVTVFTGAALGRELTMDQRMECQRAVEGVYWQHRIWPSQNPGAKPALEAVLPDDALRVKVETALRQSAALAMWGRPITTEDLQTEMNRVARASHDSTRLAEIIAALDGDPFLVAECLVRPILADQRVSELAERDTAFADWWKEEGSQVPAAIDPASDAFTPMALQTTAACTNDTWTPTTLTGAPGARSGHASLWTGSEVIVYGGMTFFGGTYDSGGFYDPATDAWRVLPSVNQGADQGGEGVSAVWTGTKMISWGGGYTGDFTSGVWNKGGRFDPTTSTWSTTSTGVNVPSPRQNHSAVWTGTRMIVWGGNDTGSGTGLDTGGVYDPVVDDWRLTNAGSVCATGPLSGHGCQLDMDCPAVCSGGWNNGGVCTGNGDCLGGCQNSPGTHCANNTECQTQGLGKCTNPPPGSCGNVGSCQAGAFHPSAAYRPSAVWTGQRMIVWGGSQGAAYDVGTDTWSPLSASNAPTSSYSNAVWTGSRMIVWGSGAGSYDPASDTWSPINPAGAPPARSGARAVWTGDEMVVWGGSTGSNYPITGGRYRPATSTWTATSTAGTPTGRAAHTAAWTGSEMVVWGGSFSRTGARYCATPVCAVSSWYYDGDGDGYGVSGVSVFSCVQPSGYAAASGDCNDAASGVHPGIAEVCGDGIDNDCDGIADDAGALTGATTMSVTGIGGGTVSWTPITGANIYDLVSGSLAVLASSHGDFALATTSCLGDDLLGTSLTDATIPAAGQGIWYLVRGANCTGPGTFDEGSASQSGSRDAEIQASGHACP